VVVAPVNDAPLLVAPPDQQLQEGGTTGLLAFTLADEDHALDGVLLSVAVSGGAVPPQGIALSGSGANRGLRLTPLPDASGQFTVTLRAEDPDGAVGTAQFALAIADINDAPVFTPGGDVTVTEDSGAHDAPWAGGIDPGPFESGQSLQFEILSLSDPSLFAVAPQVSADGRLSFTPAPDASGEAEVEVQLADDGGTANGGVDRSPVATFRIVVTAADDAPMIAAAAALVVAENGSQTLPVTVGDSEDAAADLEVEAIAADAGLIPAAGLEWSGTGAARVLTVTPAPDRVGSTTLTLTVRDSDGGQAQQTVAVTVAPADRIADLEVALDNGRDEVQGGDTLLYLGAVDNAGPGLAREVAISDERPAELLDAF